jgi:hypothetical protein
MTHAPARPRTSTATALRAVQAAAALTVLELLWQFATAGRMVGPLQDRGAHELHETGAVVLHVLTGLLTLAAIWLWRTRGGPAWPAVLSAVVFVLSFVQAYLGDDETLWLHVPGALVLSVGSIWVLAWSFTPGARLRG